MSEILQRVLELCAARDIRISEHGYDELAADDIRVLDAITGVLGGQLVEEYPNYHKGPCVLLLQEDGEGTPIHVLWGIPRGFASPAVLITAYRPDPGRWSDDFLRRL